MLKNMYYIMFCDCIPIIVEHSSFKYKKKECEDENKTRFVIPVLHDQLPKHVVLDDLKINDNIYDFQVYIDWYP